MHRRPISHHPLGRCCTLFIIVATLLIGMGSAGATYPAPVVGRPTMPQCGIWNVVKSPNVGPGHNALYAVTAITPNDVWAVGSFFNGMAKAEQTLTEHWNGNQWSIIASPNPGAYLDAD